MTANVIMITNAVAPDKLGGLERYVRELAAALVRGGVGVSVVAKRTSPDDAPVQVGDDGVTIIRHAVPDKADPFFAPKYPHYVRRGVVRALRADPGAIVHGHFPVPMLAALRLSGRTRRPYVYTFHAPVHEEILSERQGSYALPVPVQKPAVRCFRRAEAAVVSRASRVAVLSDFMRRRLADLSPAAAAGAELIPGGIDTTWFCPDTTSTEPHPQGAPLLFTARRLTPRTGVPALIDAMPAVLAAFPAARLAIAGDGHQRADVERQIADRGLTDRVTLLGRISNADLLSWYRKASLTVMPTAELEGFGLTTAESLACGTPVLVTPVGANPELVRDLDPRFLAAGADAVSLARGIVALLTAPDALRAARASLRAGARRSWSWDVVGERYLQLYERHQRSAR